MAKNRSHRLFQLDLTPAEQGFWLLAQSDTKTSFTLDYFAIGIGGHQQQGNLSESIESGILRRHVKLHFAVVRVGVTNLQFQMGAKTGKAFTASSALPNLAQTSIESVVGSYFPPLMKQGVILQVPRLATTDKSIDRRRARGHMSPYADQYEMYGMYGFAQYGFDQYDFAPYGLYREKRGFEDKRRRNVPKSSRKSQGNKETTFPKTSKSSKATQSSAKGAKPRGIVENPRAKK